MHQGRLLFIVVFLFPLFLYCEKKYIFDTGKEGIPIVYEKTIHRYLRGIVGAGPFKVTFFNSDHFSVYYKDSDSTDEYTEKILLYLETSWKKMIDEWKFQRPSYTHSFRTNVEIVTHIEVGNKNTLAVTWTPTASPKGSIPSNIEILNNHPQAILKAACAHELFHVIHERYDENEDRWFKESTAAAIQDEVFPDGFSFKESLPAWYSHWERGESLTSTRNGFYYGTSVFIQYLIKKHGGISLLKKLLEQASKKQGPSSIEAITDVLGGRKQFENTFADFAAWVFTQGHENEPNFYHFYPKFLPTAAYYMERDEANNITGDIFSPSPLSAKYFELKPPSFLMRNETLYVSLEENARISPFFDSRIIKWDIEKVGELLKGKYKIYTPDPDYQHVIKVPDFGKNSKAVIVVTNPSALSFTTLSLRYMVGLPPHPEKIHVKVSENDQTIYKALWREENKYKRKLIVEHREIYRNEYGPLAIDMTFSNPLKDEPNASIGHILIQDWKPIDEQRQNWRGKWFPNNSISNKQNLEIFIQATDMRGDILDADPQSIADMSYSGNGIDRYEIDLPKAFYQIPMTIDKRACYELARKIQEKDKEILLQQQELSREVDLSTPKGRIAYEKGGPQRTLLRKKGSCLSTLDLSLAREHQLLDTGQRTTESFNECEFRLKIAKDLDTPQSCPDVCGWGTEDCQKVLENPAQFIEKTLQDIDQEYSLPNR